MHLTDELPVEIDCTQKRAQCGHVGWSRHLRNRCNFRWIRLDTPGTDDVSEVFELILIEPAFFHSQVKTIFTQAPEEHVQDSVVFLERLAVHQNVVEENFYAA